MNVESGNYEDASAALLKSVEQTVTSEELDSEDAITKRNCLLDRYNKYRVLGTIYAYAHCTITFTDDESF